MTSEKNDDQIELQNNSSSYSVSKSLICTKIPYFKELCSSIQSFQFNLNDSCFESVINWLYTDYIFINMENVVPLHEVACEFKIESIKSDCCSFFYEHFTAERIPVLIRCVQDDTPLLNFGKLNSFLSKNFLRIVNGEYFLEFPIEAVKYIISLDLAIESEYQVFQAIAKWINHNKSRIDHLQELMKCIRWCFTFKSCYSKIAEDEFIVDNLPQLDEITCEPGDCCNSCWNDRVKEKHLLSFYSLDEKCIGISLYIGDNCWEPFGTFKEDDQIPVDIIYEEHVADFIFDSGRSGLRIDFIEMTYRWLEMSGSPSAYYSKLYTCFKPKFDKESSYRAFIQDEVRKIETWIPLEKNTLIEHNGVMNIICYPQKDSRLYCFLPVEHVGWYTLPFTDAKVHATVLNGIYYIITKSLTFRVFDSVKKTVVKFKPFAGMDLAFDDLQLVAHGKNVILLIKSQRKLMMFDTRKKIWSLMCQSNSHNKMIALTSSCIPFKFMKKLYSKKRVN